MPRKKSDPKKPDTVDAAVGVSVRTWRIARGLTQAELANRLGITFQQVQKYETGHNRMSTGRLVKTAAILGVPISALFQGADAADPAQALLADSRSFRLALAFRAIDDSKLRLTLVNMVETIATSVPQKPRKRRRG
jgi:transcriptional regulator with XRE-family HTH domain